MKYVYNLCIIIFMWYVLITYVRDYYGWGLAITFLLSVEE